jgi:hypothetical protein
VDDKQQTHNEDDFDNHEPTRADEAGEADEPDAPTAAEQNIGMNTILGHGLFSGIQGDASDE